MKKDGSRVVSVMKEYVVEVEDVDMPTPRFSCLVGYECVDVHCTAPCLKHHVEYTNINLLVSVTCMLIRVFFREEKQAEGDSRTVSNFIGACHPIVR